MEKLMEIIRLGSELSLSNRAIARALKVSRPVVSQYLSDFKATGLKYSEARELSHDDLLEFISRNKRLGNQRYEVLLERFKDYLKELKRPGVTLQLLWGEYKQEHPDGYSYSQFCYHFQIWRNGSALTMHIEHKAGDKMFVDFTGKKLTVIEPQTGAKREVEVFVAILGASQLTYAEACYTQQKADWIRANENALWYMGGVPRAIVPDCLKTGVTKGDKYDPDINPEYADFARHYGTVILPTRPHSPQDKALVENAVKIVYSRVFAPLRDQNYYSLNDLNQAIIKKVKEHNNRYFQRINISRRQLFKEIEQSVLKPLPSDKYELRSFQSLKVQFNYHVYLSCDKHYYSVPYQHRGKKVKIIYTDSYVEIYHNNIRIAFHKRDISRNKYTTIPEHMPPNHRFYHDWSPDKMIEWADKKGSFVRELVEKVLEKRTHPEQSYKVCLGVINLSKKYGEGRVDRACKRALDFHYYSYKAVKNILEKGLDKIEELQLVHQKLPEHQNIRGSEYYR
jgi:transposase